MLMMPTDRSTNMNINANTDVFYADADAADLDYEPPCTCGGIAIGGMMGFFAGICSLILSESKLTLVSVLAVSTTFGSIGSLYNNPFNMDFELFLVQVWISFGLLVLVVYYVFSDFTLLHVLGISFGLSIVLNRTTPWFAKALKNKARFSKLGGKGDKA